MAADDLKKSKSTKRLELCGILLMLIVGLAVAIAVIVYLVENKPKDSEFKGKEPDVLETPYAAVDSGVQWLRKQQTGDMWPMGQSADAILALRLGKMATYNKVNCEFRLAVKSAEFDILSAMLQDKSMVNAMWGRGLLAKYIIALRSACTDVRNFHGNDLIAILASQYSTYSTYYNGNRQALAWYTLAQCTADEDTGNSITDILKQNSGTYPQGVAEASMIAIALTCLDTWNMTMYGMEIMDAHDYLIARQRADGSFGNEFETALALQALLNSNNTKLGMIRDHGLEYLSDLIQDTYSGEYKNLAAASHIMTALGGKSFAHAKMDCPEKTMTTPSPGQPIQITIRVKGGVVNASVDQNFTVSINKGESLYDALMKLEASQSSFMFTSILRSNGRMVMSIQGLDLVMNSLQYWKIMEGSTDMTKTGVSYIIPKANMLYMFEAATY